MSSSAATAAPGSLFGRAGRGRVLLNGRHEKIRAGMRVSAEIKTGDRRVIEYLLSPVMQAVKEAGRAR
jgi:membrane fusion protein, hemolysin D